MSVTPISIPTSVGPARVHIHPGGTRARGPVPVVVLGHGAGGGIGARDLSALASNLPAEGITVVLVEQPWRVAGRRVASAPAQLDRAWTEILAHPDVAGLRTRGSRSAPLFVGGRSAGARVACRTALAVQADGVVALAFPLHPPGRPDRSRADELIGAGVRTLVVQGDRDPFGNAADLPPGPLVVRVPFADHGLAVPKSAPVTQGEILALIVDAVANFVGTREERAAGPRSPGRVRDA